MLIGFHASTAGGLNIFVTLENIVENIDVDVVSCPGKKGINIPGSLYDDYIFHRLP
jgi:hypothetical protein